MKGTYTIRDIMDQLKLNESATRKLLIDAGANLAELDQDTGETVTRGDVIALAVDRANTREGRQLFKLLNTLTIR